MGSKPAPTPRSKPIPEWKKALYAPERITRYLKGEISLQELQGVTSREMMELASTGYSLLNQGQSAKALAIFEGLAAMAPKIAWFQTAIGVVHMGADRLDAARAALDKAVALDAANLAARVNRGEVLLRQGELVKAAQDFKKAIQLDPKGEDPLTRRAQALAAAALRQIETFSATSPPGSTPPAARRNK